jgi:hypothetical protein
MMMGGVYVTESTDSTDLMDSTDLADSAEAMSRWRATSGSDSARRQGLITMEAAGIATEAARLDGERGTMESVQLERGVAADGGVAALWRFRGLMESY